MFFSVSFSTWKWSSSCVSWSWRLRVKNFIGPSLAFLQHQSNGGGESFPFVQFFFQLITTSAGERVELGPAIVVRGAPFSADPAALLQAVERGIERSLANLENVL